LIDPETTNSSSRSGLQVSCRASLAGLLRFLQSDDGAGASDGLFSRSIKQRHATMRFEEMNDVDRERLVCALDELRGAFSKRRQVGASESTYISRLTVSQRRTLFLHAGLTEQEFNEPHWRLMKRTVIGVTNLFRALRELFSLFEYAPTILTSVKPEQYLH
jgi:hypothetical protein